MKILVTGAAGFIGFHTSLKLCQENHEVHGIDNLNSYYDINLKKDRLSLLNDFQNFTFKKLDIADTDGINNNFKKFNYDVVINLAAQAGVRYSIENPHTYIESNVKGFLNILESCKDTKVNNLIYASSSSVYGANEKIPFSEVDNVDHPVSLYAATKKTNELMAHAYSHLYDLPTTGLRFFTVYGPWGRPDMSPMLFTNAIKTESPIKVFNFGKHKRDFTYIDDIVSAIIKCVHKPSAPNLRWSGLDPEPSSSKAPWRVYNIGNNNPVELLDYIKILETTIGKKANLELLPLQAGDVEATFANIDKLNDLIGYEPKTNLNDGIRKFIDWHNDYYK